MYKRIKGLYSRLIDFTNQLTGAALLVMMAVVLLQVFSRYIVFKSLTWSEEVSRYLLVFVVLLGLGMAVRDNLLIRIDAIDYALKNARVKRVLELLRSILGLVAAVIITVSSTQLFKVGRVQKSPAMQIPMIILYALVFISYLIASAGLVFRTIDCVIDVVHPQEEQMEGGGAE